LERVALPMAALLARAPAVYPFYLLSPARLFRIISKIPVLRWSASVLSTYFVWHLHRLHHAWQVPEWP
jgi:hypothetical protein